MREIIDQLLKSNDCSDLQLKEILTTTDEEFLASLYCAARKVREQYYGKKVYIRGLIEFTNYCKNDCYYCGLRRSNGNLNRYRLTKAEILDCCKEGYQLGYRTFVLQGGEDYYYDKGRISDIVKSIKSLYPDCAITLSLGERTFEEYEMWFQMGADRYLLRHETAVCKHYEKLHPKDMNFAHRMECLRQLKEIGYQVGAGFMVGSPFQTLDDLICDLRFLQEFQPHMIGIGPFLSQKDTPFSNHKNGSAELTVRLLAILRLLLPKVLLPATTALGTAASDGRERGLLAGANVVMPNLSPVLHRKDYALYDDKICMGEEGAECKRCLQSRVEKIGYYLCTDRGDSKME